MADRTDEFILYAVEQQQQQNSVAKKPRDTAGIDDEKDDYSAITSKVTDLVSSSTHFAFPSYNSTLCTLLIWKSLPRYFAPSYQNCNLLRG